MSLPGLPRDRTDPVEGQRDAGGRRDVPVPERADEGPGPRREMSAGRGTRMRRRYWAWHRR